MTKYYTMKECFDECGDYDWIQHAGGQGIYGLIKKKEIDNIISEKEQEILSI